MHPRILILIVIVVLIIGCKPDTVSRTPQASHTSTDTGTAALFENVTQRAGIHFVLKTGTNPEAPLFPQTMVAGCAFLDYDNDGWLDILLIQSGSLTPTPGVSAPHCALYHNNGNGTFTDVTAGSGLDKDLGYGQGVAIGDYDNDGYDDIFITTIDHNYLFHNEHGTGKFTDVTEKTGLNRMHSTGYATSAAFGDYDNDGKLDLYVCYYAPWTVKTDIVCHDSDGRREYCSPDVYPKDTHVLYHNEGGRFRDVSTEAGIDKVKGRGLSVAFLDYDEDGKQDIFVANDLSGNMLWHNEGNGKFKENGGEVGCRYGSSGDLMAGMGIAVGDYDQSGHESLFVTNFQDMPNMLFKNTGKGYMEDMTVFSHVGQLHMPYLSFGCEFIDYDADGWLDLITANGHVQMKGKGLEHMKQPKQLLRNDGHGAFTEVTDPGQLGDLARPVVARGLAVGDFDNDGRQDILFNLEDELPQLMHNNDRSAHHWISFKTVGTKSNRDGLHTRFLITVKGNRRVSSVRAGSSYLSVSDRRVYFGLGDAPRVDNVEIRWPSGTVDMLKDVATDHIYIVTEGKGITGEQPLSHRVNAQSAGSASRIDR